MGTGGTPTAQGAAGSLLGLPVYVDPNITTTNSTNQDIAYVGRFEDVFLWESELRLESFDGPYADSAGILFRAMAYSALIPDRYTSAVVTVTGTGMISPTL